MTQITNLHITRLAKGIGIARGVFATAYDEYASSFDSPLFKQIVEERGVDATEGIGPERDRKDYVAALRVARDSGWLIEFVVEKFGDLAAGASSEAKMALQSIVVFTERFADAKQVESGTLAASRRCCQILIPMTGDDGKIKDRAVGSGFLVGPHLVLTNHHVIAPLLDAQNGTPDPKRARPKVQFDYHKGALRDVTPETFDCVDDWLLDHSSGSGVAADAAELVGRLDYAVLRLNGLPGYARGWYDLSQVPEPPPAGNMLEIWQFPKESAMKVQAGLRMKPPGGLGFDAIAETQVPPRMYYMINTLGGSSGSLVLNQHKVPVGLHDAGFEDNKPGDAKPNRGIPLCLIARNAGSHVTQELLNLPQKIGWHPKRNEPILGRSRLQKLIFEAQKGPVRIIAILTRPDPTAGRLGQLGRSYTHMILEACLPSADHQILEFNAARIDPDPFLTAQRIVDTVNPAEIGTIPLASGETTMDADATGLLVDTTVSALLSSAPGKTVWLMIDDIDAHPIGTQWGSSTFLVALYRRASIEPALRIVLVGLPRQLEGLRDLEEEGVLQSELLGAPPSDDEVKVWMEANLADGNWPVEFGPRMTRLIRSVAQERLSSGGNGPGETVSPPGGTSCITRATAQVLATHARTAFLRRAPDNE